MSLGSTGGGVIPRKQRGQSLRKQDGYVPGKQEWRGTYFGCIAGGGGGYIESREGYPSVAGRAGYPLGASGGILLG
jgi:hypothetical protein